MGVLDDLNYLGLDVGSPAEDKGGDYNSALALMGDVSPTTIDPMDILLGASDSSLLDDLLAVPEVETQVEYSRRRLHERLKSQKIKAEVTEHKGATRLYFTVLPDLDKDVDKMLNKKFQEYIESPMGVNGVIELSTSTIGAMVISILLDSKDINPMNIINYVNMGVPNTSRIPLGEVQGKILVVDLFKEFVHLLVSGTSGAGKSQQLNSLIQALEWNYRDNHDGLSITFISPKIDPRGADLRIFEPSPFLKSFVCIHDDWDLYLQQVLNACNAFVTEMNITMTEDKLNILVFDELEFVLDKEKSKDAAAKKRDAIRTDILYALQQVGRVGRGKNFRLMLGTQSPRADIIRPLKANINILAGKAADSDEAGIVGIKQATMLDGNGHFAKKGGAKGMPTFLQGFMFEPDFYSYL